MEFQLGLFSLHLQSDQSLSHSILIVVGFSQLNFYFLVKFYFQIIISKKDMASF